MKGYLIVHIHSSRNILFPTRVGQYFPPILTYPSGEVLGYLLDYPLLLSNIDIYFEYNTL